VYTHHIYNPYYKPPTVNYSPINNGIHLYNVSPSLDFFIRRSLKTYTNVYIIKCTCVLKKKCCALFVFYSISLFWVWWFRARRRRRPFCLRFSCCIFHCMFLIHMLYQVNYKLHVFHRSYRYQTRIQHF